MKQQQNLKTPSAKYCIMEGHQMELVNHFCTNKYCKSNNRWICIKCVLQKKHSNKQCDNHIVDQEMFYNILKDKQEEHLKYIKKIQQQIMFFVKKFKILLDDINLTLQQLEKNITALKENYNLKLINQLIQITEEDFSQLQNEQIIGFHNLNIHINFDFQQEFKQNVNRINQDIQTIIKDIDQIYCGDQNQSQIRFNSALKEALYEGKIIMEQDQQKQKQVPKYNLFKFIKNDQ